MKRSAIIWIVVIIVIVVVGGIWYWSSSRGTQNAGSASTSGSTATTTNNAGTNTVGTSKPKSPTSTSTAVVLNSERTTALGTYLVATNGMTLYQSTKDRARVSNCMGTCATVWPPYTVPVAEESALLGSTPGITGAIGTIRRPDGTIQVTYNNMPLYFYNKDQVVGDAKGQSVGGFVIVNL